MPPQQSIFDHSRGRRSGWQLSTDWTMASARPPWLRPTLLGAKSTSGTKNRSLLRCNVGAYSDMKLTCLKSSKNAEPSGEALQEIHILCKAARLCNTWLPSSGSFMAGGWGSTRSFMQLDWSKVHFRNPKDCMIVPLRLSCWGLVLILCQKALAHSLCRLWDHLAGHSPADIPHSWPWRGHQKDPVLWR